MDITDSRCSDVGKLIKSETREKTNILVNIVPV